MRFAIIMLLVALAADAAVPHAAPAFSVPQILDTYLQGRYDEAVRTAASVGDLEQFRVRFILDAPGWIRSDPVSIEKRRRASAAFVAELTHARLESEWKLFRDLIEWTCADLRAAGAAAPFERSWHLAVLALAGRARDRAWLLGAVATLPDAPRRPQPKSELGPLHLYHVADRFPDDGRLRLEWITAWTWGRDREPTRNGGVRLAAFQIAAPLARQVAALTALRPLTSDPETAAGALLRTAQLHFVLGDYAAARDAARRARVAASAVDERYVAHIIAGRALEALEERGDAKREYERAVETIPEAESGAIALAGIRFAADDGAAALAVLERSFARRPQTDDPWRLFSYGSFAKWPVLLTALRAELQR